MKKRLLHVAAASLCVGLLMGGQAYASSHREAPPGAARPVGPAAGASQEASFQSIWTYITSMFSRSSHKDPPRIQVLR